MIEHIAIDARTWADGDDARRAEWRRAIDALRGAAALLSFPADAVRLEVGVTEQATSLTLLDAAGRTVATCAIPRSALSSHVAEYVDIVRQIDRAEQGLGGPRLEALDMAKKLAHDDAARALAPLVAPLAADHETCRLLFSLLLTLRVDTTRLVGIRAHRPVR